MVAVHDATVRALLLMDLLGIPRDGLSAEEANWMINEADRIRARATELEGEGAWTPSN